MRPRRTASTDQLIRLPGGTEDNDLHARRDPAGWATVWEPSQAERAAIATGANVELLVSSPQHPPVSVIMTREQPLSRPQRTFTGPVLWFEVNHALARSLYALLSRPGSIPDPAEDPQENARLIECADFLRSGLAELDRLAAQMAENDRRDRAILEDQERGQ